MKTFNHLSLREREIISKMCAQGMSQRFIGKTIGRHPSTIGRDMKRNGMTPQTYWALDADFHADCRAEHAKKPHKIENDRRLKTYVHRKLRGGWSPEQIANMFEVTYPHDMTMRVSHETIYTYLYCLPRGELKKELVSYLRRARKERQKRSGTYQARGQNPDMVSISERPAEVADRIIPGHWEGTSL